MPAAPAPISAAALTTLAQPLLQPDETIVLTANGRWEPLEPHDGLTMAFLRLTGRWRPQAFALVLTDRRLLWLELSPKGAITAQRDYRLPLKGRLIRQSHTVIETQLPGELRRFLTFADGHRAGELYRRIDERQRATQQAYPDTPEVIGVGVKPASALHPATLGAHGETVVPQHELVSEIRPSFRP